MNRFESKEQVREMLENSVRFLYRRELDSATDEQIYFALANVVRDKLMDVWIDSHDITERSDGKKLYYMSMEFLVGRSLESNIAAIDSRGYIEAALRELGISKNLIEDQERDPALGNGGLGRLAACFLESLATQGYPAYGCGIRYRYGLFRQKIISGEQQEVPDNWLKDGYPFEVRRSEYTCEVHFGGEVATLWDGHRNYFELRNYQAVKAVPYDIPVVGYGGNYVNTLRTWSAEPVEEFNLKEFDEGHYQKAVEQEKFAHNICAVLYPKDSHREGKELRLRQQYFFVSATVQTALRKFLERHSDIRELPKHVVFHMNDTHPTLCVAELMRLLLDEHRLEWDEAWEIMSSSCCFTNHTIMSEALECWPEDLIWKMLPRIMQIITEMNRRLLDLAENLRCERDLDLKDLEILHNGTVRMANMAVYACHYVNGVAEIHSKILTETTFHEFYKLFPEKFGNKTNGITQRRFLLEANPELSAWITEKIGNGWITDLDRMKELLAFSGNTAELKKLLEIRRNNKIRLGEYIEKHNRIKVDPDSIFDVQVKRLHEYKRQLMNILFLMELYQKLKKDPSVLPVPVTAVFGAKAAPGYSIAKQIIRLINDVAETVNHDESVKGRLRIVFIEDYCVSNAELIFPAADISEQISTASKEASGTSNMKFMANGAVTLGTYDGANIEILEEAGEANEVMFGLKADEVLRMEREHSYHPEKILKNDPALHELLVSLVNGTYAPDDPERYRDIYDSLTEGENPDCYFILADFSSYRNARMKAYTLYADRLKWAEMGLENMANCGKFSSDRTIREYVNDYWKLNRISADAEKEGSIK